MAERWRRYARLPTSQKLNAASGASLSLPALVPASTALRLLDGVKIFELLE